MNWLTKLFSQPRTAARRNTSGARPMLESLERRDVPTVTFHGGAVLPHVEVQGVYYGQDWNNNATYKSQAQYLEGYLKFITNSTYMDMLTNAGYGVGRGTDTPGKIILTNPNKSFFLNDSTIRSDLQAQISNRSLAAPDSNRLYVIFVEDNVAVRMSDGSNSIRNFLGYHGAFAGRDATGRGADIRYAVITYPGGSVGNASIRGLSAVQGITEVASHELAEAVTDPDVNYKRLGWYDDRLGEIGDIVNGQYVNLNGYIVQKESDKNDHALTPVGARPAFASAADWGAVVSQLVSTAKSHEQVADTVFSAGLDLVK